MNSTIVTFAVISSTAVKNHMLEKNKKLIKAFTSVVFLSMLKIYLKEWAYFASLQNQYQVRIGTGILH